jgi:hypothetical protein
MNDIFWSKSVRLFCADEKSFSVWSSKDDIIPMPLCRFFTAVQIYKVICQQVSLFGPPLDSGIYA